MLRSRSWRRLRRSTGWSKDVSGLFSVQEVRARSKVSRAKAGPFKQLCEALGGPCGAQKQRASASRSGMRARGWLRAQGRCAWAGGAPSMAVPRAERGQKAREVPLLPGGCRRSGLAISLRSYFFAPPALPPATCSPRKESGAALWQVARRTHARKGKSGLRGCRNLDFDAAQC